MKNTENKNTKARYTATGLLVKKVVLPIRTMKYPSADAGDTALEKLELSSDEIHLLRVLTQHNGVFDDPTQAVFAKLVEKGIVRPLGLSVTSGAECFTLTAHGRDVLDAINEMER